MPKLLATPETIVAQRALVVNRKDITAFHVDVAGSIVIHRTVLCRDMDASNLPIAGLTLQAPLLTGDAARALIADAGSRVALAVLAACGVSSVVIASVTAQLAATPALAETAYYNGTRDALYATV